MERIRTIRSGKLGKVELHLAQKGKAFFGLADRKVCVEGTDPDDVWRRLHDEAGKVNPKYFGFDGARARFLQHFPNGFHSDHYVNAERQYKLVAKDRLETTAPLDVAVNASGLGEAVLAAYNATNLLSPFEKMRVRDALRSPSADAFIRAAARFTLGEGERALQEMDHALKPHDAAKWTVVTYLPFLWRPEEHMYLKPSVTKDFAARVGHRFASDYETRLSFDVYESLLNLVTKTNAELAELRPRDRIDVQSFIWVVGAY